MIDYSLDQFEEDFEDTEYEEEFYDGDDQPSTLDHNIIALIGFQRISDFGFGISAIPK